MSSSIPRGTATAAEVRGWLRSEPPSALDPMALADIKTKLAANDPYLWSDPVEIVIANGKTFVVNGHHRLTAVTDAATGYTGTVPYRVLTDAAAKASYGERTHGGTMNLELVLNYVHDAMKAYQACTAALGISASQLDLFALSRAARSGEVMRRGELVTRDGVHFGYHIHGTGYSFTELSSGRQADFDVCVVGDNQSVRFTAWHLQRYASSIGQDLTRDAVQAALDEPDAKELRLIHKNSPRGPSPSGDGGIGVP